MIFLMKSHQNTGSKLTANTFFGKSYTGNFWQKKDHRFFKNILQMYRTPAT